MYKLSGYLIGVGVIGLLIQIAGSSFGGVLLGVAAVWLAWETWKPRKTPSTIFDASREEPKRAAAAEPAPPTQPAPSAAKMAPYQSHARASKAARFAAERKRVEQAVQERQAQASQRPLRTGDE